MNITECASTRPSDDVLESKPNRAMTAVAYVAICSLIIGFAALLIPAFVHAAGTSSDRAIEPKLSPLPPRYVIRTEPAVPVAGQAVSIIVEGIWPDGCIPTAAKASIATYQSLLTLTLPGPPERILCFSSLTPYKITIPEQTFSIGGQYNFTVVDTWGRLFGTQSVSVSLPDGKQFSTWNVNGAWSEARTGGSGLMLVHEKAGQLDRTFGAWFLYGQSGKPTWFTLQAGEWETPTSLVGDVYETSTFPIACNPSNPPTCPSVFDPVASQEVKKVGRFQMSFSNSYTATLKFFGATPYSDSRSIELERLGAR